jgi:hypothetical protein
MQNLTISWFPTAFPPPKTPALGESESLSWDDFCNILSKRREGDKDGPGFVPARFSPEGRGKIVRRKKSNLLARTAVALDIESNKKTGEIPPAPEEMSGLIRSHGLASVIYTSHSHTVIAPRYRIVFQLSDEIGVDIPAPDIVARRLNVSGVLDTSKDGAASFFYSPSCASEEDTHFTQVISGVPLASDEITAEGMKILASQKAEMDRIAEESHRLAAQRAADKLASGFSSDDSLIEKLRSHLDLESILLTHGYAKAGQNFRHPNSSSGQFGSNIKNFGGIDRVFSHNATDPLHASNLPEWCGRVTALDAFDVTAILDYGSDRRQAMISLAEKFNLTKTAERKQLCRIMFQLIRRQAPQQEIENISLQEGARLGFSPDEVCKIAQWVVSQSVEPRA